MMKLYWSPRSRSFSALWLMEETGQPYERVLTDITTGAQRSPEYLAINPMGKVPAIKDGDATMAEAAARQDGEGGDHRSVSVASGIAKCAMGSSSDRAASPAVPRPAPPRRRASCDRRSCPRSGPRRKLRLG